MTSSDENDWTALMRSSMAGDEDAYRQFLTLLAPRLRAAARSRCRLAGVPDSEAEDIVQEVLLAIHLKRGTWDQSRPIAPWVAAITRNKLIDLLRRRRRNVSVPIEDVADSLRIDDVKPALSSRNIDRLLAQLKPQQRDIVQSISLEAHSIRETAGRLRMSEGAVRVALHRALKALGVLYRSGSREDG